MSRVIDAIFNIKGFQMKSHICVREHTQVQVPPKRCHNIEKPMDIQVRCNTGPCPPR